MPTRLLPLAPYVRAAVGLSLAAFFAWCAWVQLNDVDLLPWVSVYGAVAGLSAWSVLRPAPWRVAAAVASVCVLWALWILPSALGLSGPFLQTEEGREVLGLFLAAGGALVSARPASVQKSDLSRSERV